jgi:predicted regulator of Ras-like GTPase activity (Roadblock/LC7/MglB family)
MSGLPELDKSDQEAFARTLDDFLIGSRALRVFLLERAGYILCRAGRTPEIDSDQFAALASNAFNAIEELARGLDESDFKTLHQRGGRHQTLIFRIEESCLLVAIFPSDVGITDIERVAESAIVAIADQLSVARARLPTANVDLADQNPHQFENMFFRRKPS